MWDACRINGEKEKIDCGLWRKGLHAFHHVGERQFVEPCERNSVLESLKTFLQLPEPIFFYWRISNHHRHMGRFWPHSQNVLDDSNLINRGCKDSVIRC